ncbi:MAG: alanine:cation symporter family protein, partial [Clostridia bacterium]|nr:alanine:cation symporter family protein [Clostridia bacterium]
GIMLSMLAAAVFFFKIDLFGLSSVIVPFMSVGYVVCALAVILLNAEQIPQTVQSIFSEAFDTKAAAGGALGFVFTPAMRQGIVKGLFSNEAGCGTAPMAHAASAEKVPARQGLFGVFEVFVDTVLMCTLTAFTILLTGVEPAGGVRTCIEAFGTVFGAVASPILAISVLLFAFSAIVSFGYYGTKCLEYFKAGDTGRSVFLIAYCLSVFVGAALSPAASWKIADMVVCFMLILNTSAVVCSRKEIFTAHNAFYSQMGKYSHKASKTRSLSPVSIKNASPMSDTDINRGSML